MGVDVQVETTIDRSPAEVAAYAGDPGNAPEWYANIDSVSWRTDPPMGVGSRMTLRNRGNPSGFARIAGPAMERAMRRVTTKDLARLKQVLES